MDSMEEINHNSWSYNLHVLYGYELLLLGEEARFDQKLLFIDISFDANYDSN